MFNKTQTILAVLLNFSLVGIVVFQSIELARVKESVSNEVEQKYDQFNYLSPFKPYTFEVDFYGLKYLGHSDNIIDDYVLYYGAYEKDILYFMRDVMLHFGKAGSIFVDIGANTGHHSLFMSNYAESVHAFEPYKVVLETFYKIIEINGINNIEVHPVGLGDRNEEVTFFEPPENNLGTGTFVNAYTADKTEGQKLQIMKGDDALKDVDLSNIRVIKMDIEGYEKPALTGLRNTLETARPFVVFEISIDPDVDYFFKSKNEILDLFPENYEILAFQKSHANLMSGNYQFEEFRSDFNSIDRFDLIAYPKEQISINLQ